MCNLFTLFFPSGKIKKQRKLGRKLTLSNGPAIVGTYPARSFLPRKFGDCPEVLQLR